MNPITQALHHKLDDRDAFPVVTPLYQASAFQAHSPYFYTRKDNPNSAEFEQTVAIMEGARHATAFTTGMSAISAALHLLRPGDRLAINKDIYGCSYKLFQRHTRHFGMRLDILDLSTAEGIAALPADTAMVLFETPTNPFLKTVPIARVAERIKALNPRALIVVDNTWATPLFQRPLDWGADLSLHSGTKYFSGHSDVMGGIVLTQREDLHEALRATRFYNGMILDPHSAWLMRRSLQTLAIRLDAHQRATRRVVEFLKTCPEVVRVYTPEIDGRQLTGYGALIFFELRGDLVPHYKAFAEALDLFSTGTGMACVTSMVAQPYTGSHASMTSAEKAEMGLGPDLVRLSFGLEDPKDLCASLRRGFDRIGKE
jgi:cystathionine gamma-lyase/cystathionine gamma-lyase/homocysteine desulfhydrase